MNKRQFNQHTDYLPSAYGDDDIVEPVKARPTLDELTTQGELDLLDQCGDVHPEPTDPHDRSDYISQEQSDRIHKTNDERASLAKGSEEAKELLEKRLQAVKNIGHRISFTLNHSSNIVPTAGTFLGASLFDHMYGLVAYPLSYIVTYGAKRLNKYMVRKQTARINYAIKAIDKCNDRSVDEEEKKHEYEKLLFTAYRMRRWETTEKIGIIATRILFARTSKLIEGFVNIREIVEGFKQEKKPETYSKESARLMAALIRMDEGLHLHRKEGEAQSPFRMNWLQSVIHKPQHRIPAPR